MDSILVKVKNVSKIIEHQTLVDRFSIDVEKGHVVALCGGNGAGKSTVLRLIGGIYRPSMGTITINELSHVIDRKKYSMQIGYMPDEYPFNQAFSPQEVLSFCAALRRVPKKRITEVLVMVGLENNRHDPVKTFSKGMRQRLLFAQAILADVALLVMDEPTNGLDPFWMDQFVSLMKKMKEKGKTIIFSTHELNVASRTADQLVFLKGGKQVGGGLMQDVCEKFGSIHAAFEQSLIVQY